MDICGLIQINLTRANCKKNIPYTEYTVASFSIIIEKPEKSLLKYKIKYDSHIGFHNKQKPKNGLLTMIF